MGDRKALPQYRCFFMGRENSLCQHKGWEKRPGGKWNENVGGERSVLMNGNSVPTKRGYQLLDNTGIFFEDLKVEHVEGEQVFCCSGCWNLSLKWRANQKKQQKVYAMFGIVESDLPAVRERHKPAIDVIRLTYTDDNGRPSTGLVSEPQHVKIVRHLDEWRKAQIAGRSNALHACAETIMTDDTVLYNALLHKLTTRVEARVM